MMLHTSSVALLSNLPLFAGASDSSLEAILFMSTHRVFRPGEPILTIRDRVHFATLIVAGEAEQGGGNGAAPVLYGPGTLLQEKALFFETVSDRTVVARSLVQVVEISPAALNDVLRTDPELTRLLTGRIADRLHRLSTQLKQLDQTLARLDQAGEPVNGPVEGPVNGAADRTPPEPAHDRTAAPSHAPRRPPASNGTNGQAPASPRHGPAGVPGSSGASPSPGSSTR